ncbi:MAG: prephenate dehydrogenase/arogenate dehydrogenase family protein [Gemmatimonadetes bacterium]|nr:prephenate dehydrogenase/arogenate dehydrogenase family protein [Gemmatimonadota bacterium]
MTEGTSGCGFDRIGIVGVGLMGGSMARGLRALNAPPHVVGFSLDPADGRLALECGAIDELATDSAEAARGRDLVVYATPLGVTLDFLGQHSAVWGEAAITDVASLKAPVMDRVKELSEASRYVGSHPMTGGEGSGFAASSDGLFRDARVWLVRGEGATRAAGGVERLWRALGATPLWTDALEHDQRMTWVSQLPQLVANGLAATLAEAGYTPADLGPGGKDMTRLAASSPEMWRDVLETSAPRLAGALEAAGVELARMAAALEAGDLAAITELMARTKEWKG